MQQAKLKGAFHLVREQTMSTPQLSVPCQSLVWLFSVSLLWARLGLCPLDSQFIAQRTHCNFHFPAWNVMAGPAIGPWCHNVGHHTKNTVSESSNWLFCFKKGFLVGSFGLRREHHHPGAGFQRRGISLFVISKQSGLFWLQALLD